ncbi:hypothetical protein Tco_0083493 [Tanacetum coccineum]
MARKSVNFSGNITLLFASMLVQNQAPEGEGSAIHPEPQSTSSTSQTNVLEPQIASLHIETSPTIAPQTETSVPLDHGADEAVHKEGGDSVERAITTYASLDVGQDSGSHRRQETMRGTPAQTRMEQTFELTDNVPSTPHDSPLIGGYTTRSDESRMKLDKLITLYIKLSKQVLELEKEKDAQAVEILNLKKRVKKLETKRKLSISHTKKRKYRQVM